MATFFSIVVSTRIRNDLHIFKVDSSDILFHSSSMVVLSEPMFGYENRSGMKFFKIVLKWS